MNIVLCGYEAVRLSPSFTTVAFLVHAALPFGHSVVYFAVPSLSFLPCWFKDALGHCSQSTNNVASGRTLQTGIHFHSTSTHAQHQILSMHMTRGGLP